MCPHFQSFMHSAKEEARICAAKVLSIISESMEEKDFIQQIKEMIGDVENKVIYIFTIIIVSSYRRKWCQLLIHNVEMGL